MGDIMGTRISFYKYILIKMLELLIKVLSFALSKVNKKYNSMLPKNSIILYKTKILYPKLQAEIEKIFKDKDRQNNSYLPFDA